MAEPPPGFIPARRLGILLNLSMERLRQLSKAGTIPAAKNGAYPLVGAVQGYLRFLTSNPGRTDGAATALADAKRREIELRNGRAEAKLIETSDVEAFFAHTLSALRVEIAASMKSLDTRVAPLALAAANQAFNRAEAKIAEALNNLRGGRDPLKDDDDED
ncbi:hypothetical protein DEA98_22910 [Brucella pseudogrignonensis]|uniref:Terminase small subunit, Nu1 n=1 Tax=Brucella pseudogrignonensis TaxID=419475 RepID=A0A7Y3T5B6_9HYPH|nr:hypothetical protein [Brucella pseudogrignonensis]MCM0752937.1 hypothetical protein [Brucella pseudogrignonensis]NNV19532.1 hypothetical protein [Brucella pseudogrignonensis]